MALVLDFDGTVTVRDVGAEITRTFGLPGYEQGYQRYFAGQFGGREAMEWEYRHLPPDALAEMSAYARENGEVRAGLRALLDFCHDRDIPVEVASNGMDFYIRALLNRDGFSDLPFVSPVLSFSDGQPVSIAMPPGVETCDNTGLCKCARIQRMRARGRKVVYVGDGVSDRCVASRHEPDILLARASLKEFCEEHSIPHRPFETLEDVKRELAGLLGEPS